MQKNDNQAIESKETTSNEFKLITDTKTCRLCLWRCLEKETVSQIEIDNNLLQRIKDCVQIEVI